MQGQSERKPGWKKKTKTKSRKRHDSGRVAKSAHVKGILGKGNGAGNSSYSATR
jgi:hypothetical protein